MYTDAHSCIHDDQHHFFSLYVHIQFILQRDDLWFMGSLFHVQLHLVKTENMGRGVTPTIWAGHQIRFRINFDLCLLFDAKWGCLLTFTMSDVMVFSGMSLGSVMWTSCSSATIQGKSWGGGRTCDHCQLLKPYVLLSEHQNWISPLWLEPFPCCVLRPLWCGPELKMNNLSRKRFKNKFKWFNKQGA